MGVWETVWKSILLGTVQGLTEFLPVSSSGHLELARKLLGADFGSEAAATFFDVMMHMGTLFAVVAVLFGEIVSLFKKPLKPLRMLLAASVPAGAAGLVVSIFDWNIPLGLLPVFFLFTALLLLVTEFVSRRGEGRTLGWRQTLPMGFAQAVAILPGISRSGSTVAAGILAGGKREEVAKFSFLMSIPVILGAAVVSGIKLALKGEGLAGTGSFWLGTAAGTVCAAASGYLAVRVMMRAVSSANYKWFSLYLVLLSLVCIWLRVIGIL